MRVYWVFPKPLDIKPSVLDGILGLQFALCGTGNFKQAACTSNIFIGLNWDGLQELLWTYFD